MHRWEKIVFSIIALITSTQSFSQAGVNITPSTGFMRSEGKIYVVMAVAVVILTGLILYLFRLDRKITKLEKRENL